MTHTLTYTCVHSHTHPWNKEFEVGLNADLRGTAEGGTGWRWVAWHRGRFQAGVGTGLSQKVVGAGLGAQPERRCTMHGEQGLAACQAVKTPV